MSDDATRPAPTIAPMPGRAHVWHRPFGPACVIGCPNGKGTCLASLKPSPDGEWINEGTDDKPTLIPSYNCVKGCGWHGYVKDGVLEEAKGPTVNVEGCVRCGENHQALPLTEVTADERQAFNVAPELTHKAECPKTGQAIYGALPKREEPLEVRVNFPVFDVFALRQQGPRIRHPNDRSMDQALVRDVMNVAEYSKKVAAVAAIEVANIGQQALSDKFEQRIAQTVAELGPIVDVAINRGIEAYDAWRRAEERNNAWHRRLRGRVVHRWLTLLGRNTGGVSTPTPTSTPQPPAEAR